MDGEDMTVKARMLKLLEQHENELRSGEAAAAELNCTRAAIWKAVKSLREEGYTIEAGPNKGYVLRGGRYWRADRKAEGAAEAEVFIPLKMQDFI